MLEFMCSEALVQRLMKCLATNSVAYNCIYLPYATCDLMRCLFILHESHNFNLVQVFVYGLHTSYA